MKCDSTTCCPKITLCFPKYEEDGWSSKSAAKKATIRLNSQNGSKVAAEVAGLCKTCLALQPFSYVTFADKGLETEY